MAQTTVSDQRRGGMETMREALTRLEQRGFTRSLRARPGGLLEFDRARPALAPESLLVEEVVRFEGESDPGDEAVLFALRSRDGEVQGTFVAAYGPQMDRESVMVAERLNDRG